MLSFDELLDETWKLRKITNRISRIDSGNFTIGIIQFMMLHEMINFEDPFITRDFCSKYDIGKTFVSMQTTDLLKKNLISSVTSNKDHRIHFLKPTLLGEKTYQNMIPFVGSEIKSIKHDIEKLII